MADIIENRVVELDFDNRKFEQNARQSISTLGKLDDAMQFKGVSSGFRSIQKGLRYIDFSPVTSGLNAVQNAFTNIGAAIKVNFFDMLGNKAIQLGQTIANNTIGQIKSGGYSRALNIEQAQFKVKGLGADWDTVYEDMSYGVQDTAYGIDEAANAASQFLASGVKTGDDMKAALRGISGIAAMTSSGYSEIADIYTAAAGKGRVQAMELQRISMRGINAAAELGKQLGKTEEEVRDMASKGEIDFQTFANAMDNAFGEHAKQANETYSGSLSNVKAALSRIGEIWYEPWLHGLVPIFNELRTSIDIFKNALKADVDGSSVAKEISNILSAGSSLIVQITQTFTPALETLKTKMTPIISSMKAIEDRIESLTIFFKALKKVQEDDIDTDATKEQTKATAEQTKTNKLSTKALANASKVAKFASLNLAEFKDTYHKAVAENIGINAVMKDSLLNLDQNTGLTIASIIDSYDDLYDSQKSALESSVNLFSEWGHSYDTTMYDLQNSLDSNKEGMEMLMEDMAEIAKSGVSDDFIQYLKNMGTSGADIVHALAGATKEDLKEYVSEWEATNKMFDTVATEWTKGAKDTAEQTLQAITGVPEATLEDAAAMFNGLYNQMGMDAADSYYSGFGSIYSDVQAQYKTLVGDTEDTSESTDSATSSTMALSTATKTAAEDTDALAKAEKKLDKYLEEHEEELKALTEAWDTISEALSNVTVIFDNIKTVFSTFVEAFKEVFGVEQVDTLKAFAGSIGDIFKGFALTEKQTGYLKRIFVGFFNVVDYGIAVIKNLFDFVTPLFGTLSTGGSVVLDILAKVADFFTGLNSARKETGQFSPLIQSIINIVKTGIAIIYEIFVKFLQVIHIVGQAFGEVWDEFSPENTGAPNFLYTIFEMIKNFEISGERAEALKNIFKGLFSIVHTGLIILGTFVEKVGNVFEKLFGDAEDGTPILLRILGSLGDWVHELMLAIAEAVQSGGLFGIITTVFSKISEGISSFVNSDDASAFGSFFANLKDNIKAGIEKVVGWFKAEKPISKIFSFFGSFDFTGVFGTIFEQIGGFIKWLSEALLQEDGILSKFLTLFVDIFGGIATIIQNQLPNIDRLFTNIFDFLNRFFENNPELADKAGEVLINLASALASAFQVLAELLPDLVDPLKELAGAITEIIKALGDIIKKWMEYGANNPEQGFGAVAFVLLVWIINRFLQFFKTTSLVSFGVALRRIYTSISNFFGNLSGLAYQASGLIKAKSISTIATAILKIAAAIALISVVVGYHSDHYDGSVAGIYMLVFVIVAMIGLVKTLKSANGPLQAGTMNLFGLSMAISALGTVILLVGIAFAIVSAACSKIAGMNLVGSIVAFVVVIAGVAVLIGMLEKLLVTMSTLGKGTTKNMLLINTLLGTFAVAILILSIAFKILVGSVKKLYLTTGDSNETIALLFSSVAIMALMIGTIAGLLYVLATMPVIQAATVGSFMVMTVFLIIVMSALTDMVKTLAKNDVSLGDYVGLYAIFILAVATMAYSNLAINALKTYTQFLTTMETKKLLLAFVLLSLIISQLLGTMSFLTITAMSMKLISLAEIGKLALIMLEAAALFAIAAVCVQVISSTSSVIGSTKSMLITGLLVAALFTLLISAVASLAALAVLANTFSIDEVGKVGLLFVMAAGLFVLAGGVLAIIDWATSKTGGLAKGTMTMVILVMIMFELLTTAVVQFSNLAILAKSFTMDEIEKVGMLFLAAAGLLILATAMIVVLQWLSKKDVMNQSKLKLIKNVGAVVLIINAMIGVVKMLGQMAIEFKKNGVGYAEIEMISTIFVVVAATMAVLMGLMLGGAWVIGKFPTIGAGMSIMTKTLLTVVVCIYLIAAATDKLTDSVIKFATSWSTIRTDLWDMIEDLSEYIPHLIDNVTEGILMSLPSILLTLTVLFLAINAWLTMMAPVQAAFFMIAINAFLDVLLASVGLIANKLLIMIDILLAVLNSHAYIIGYEVSMIILRALLGALVAITDFMATGGFQTADAFLEAMRGHWVDKQSESKLIDTLVNWVIRVKVILAKSFSGTGESFKRMGQYITYMVTGQMTDGLEEEMEQAGYSVTSAYYDPEFIRNFITNRWATVYEDADREMAEELDEWGIGWKDAPKKDNEEWWASGKDVMIKQAEDKYQEGLLANVFNTDKIDEMKEAYGTTDDDIVSTLADKAASNVDSEKIITDMVNSGAISNETGDKLRSFVNKDQVEQSGADTTATWAKGLMAAVPINMDGFVDTVKNAFGNMDFGGADFTLGTNTANNIFDSLKEQMGIRGDEFNSEGGITKYLGQFNDMKSIEDLTNLDGMDDINSYLSGMDAYGEGDLDLSQYTDALYDDIDAQVGVNGLDYNIDAQNTYIDPQLETLAKHLETTNSLLEILKDNIASSVILTKESTLTLINEIDGEVVGIKAYPTVQFMGEQDAAMADDGLAVPYGHPAWNKALR